jgi:hypothetical protein
MQTLKALEGLGLVGLSNVKDDVKDLKWDNETGLSGFGNSLW